MSIPELHLLELATKEKVTAMLERHKAELAPLWKELAEIDALWPKRIIVWRDLETGCPIRTEQERMPVNPFVKEKR